MLQPRQTLRSVACRMLGRDLDPNELATPRDGNPRNLDPYNVVIRLRGRLARPVDDSVQAHLMYARELLNRYAGGPLDTEPMSTEPVSTTNLAANIVPKDF